MLKITFSPAADGTLRLELEGRVVGEWVDELRRHVLAAAEAHPLVVLDLSRVDFASAEAIRFLSSLPPSRTRVEGCSPLLTDLLDRESA